MKETGSNNNTEPSIYSLQEQIWQNKVKKGFNTENVPLEFGLLYGEVGEAFDAWRKKRDDLSGELADIFIYTLGLASILEIDMGDAIAKKMKVNESRKYVHKNGILIKEEE